MNDILSDNGLIAGEHQVYVRADADQANFAYSDGEEVERYLEEVFASADDLSTGSMDLQRKIIDWPTEYHLSGDRANLLRPFNFDGAERVLELGSGCGAISRYLGELGKQVDAIEGSAVRARLGRMRCRELDNVRVINANYNELQIPQGYYDLVVFVGVIEYASRFHPGAKSDRDAALQVLKAARGMLRPGGVVLVAIENRLGMKYQLGAHEDHYGNRYIGIDGYRNSAGIATYSAPQWHSLATDAGFVAPRFSYPFPDYKLPRVVLSEAYVDSNPEASNHLEGLVSRDYYAPVTRSITEAICWQAASGGGFLGDVANSFVLVLGEDGEQLDCVQNFDFCHGPGRGRRREFAVTTKKLSAQGAVEKQLLYQSNGGVPSQKEDHPDAGVTQVLAPDNWHRGQLLSARWLRDIAIYVRRQEFEQNLRDYYAFVQDLESRNELAIDLLPINIIVTPEGRWEVFDQEWQVDWPVTAPYLLFRSLLTFIVSNWVYISDFLRWLELQTVRDFIEFGFHANQIHLSEHLDQFVAWENRFQRAISAQPEGIDVTALLATVFEFEGSTESGREIYSTLWWRGADEAWQEQRSLTIASEADPALHTLNFAVESADQISAIRFDPFDLRKPGDVGFFSLQGIRLLATDGDRSEIVWSADGSAVAAPCCHAEGAEFVMSEQDGLQASSWIATSDFPKLVFDIDPVIPIDPKGSLRVEIDLSITRSAEYVLAYQHYLVKAKEGEKRARNAEANLTALKTVTDHERARLEADLEIAARDTRSHLAELEAIKSSRAFRLGTRFAGLLSPLAKLKGRPD